MRRREFVALIGGAAFAMPNVARQQHAMLVITLVSGHSSNAAVMASRSSVSEGGTNDDAMG
jgi:hypothetical protein